MKVEAGHLDEGTLNMLLDRALAGEALTSAQAHLAACPACGRRLAELTAVCAAIEALPDLPLRRGLAEEVVASIRTGAPRRTWRLAAAAGLQTLLAVGLLAVAWGRVTATIDSVGQIALHSLETFWASWVALPVAAVWMQAQADSTGTYASALAAMNRLSLDVSGVKLSQALALAVGGAILAIAGNALLVRGSRASETEA